MQVTFTAVPGHGHVNPMVPLARAMVTRGHDVTFVTGKEMVARVEQLGFPCIAAGPTLEAMQSNALADPEVRSALATEPWRVAAAIFGKRAGLVMDDLSHTDVNPDLVVHDAYELAGPVLAARRGAPWVTHGLGPRWPSYLEDALGPHVEGAWRAQGAEPEPRGGLGSHAYIEICPEVTRSDDSAETDFVIEARSMALHEESSPPDLSWASGRQRVYATMGTFSNADAAPFRVVLGACENVDADVLLTVGDRIDLTDLDPLPSNVSVERYVPQAQVLNHCDLVITHGGSGTVLAALAAAVPVVIVPQGADQFRNAPFWERSGAVGVVPIEQLGENSLRSALARARPGADLQRAATSVAAAITEMPSPEQTASRLEALVQS